MCRLNEALGVAEELLDAELRCPLGGDYELVKPEGLPPVWQSTSWPDQAGGPPPADYKAPLLEWFRGADAHLNKTGDNLMVHAEIDMQRKPEEKPKFELPLFNLFGGGQKALKPDAKSKAAAEELPPPFPPCRNPRFQGSFRPRSGQLSVKR